MNMKLLLGHLVMWTTIAHLSQCAEILLLTPFGSQSHKNLFFTVAETLAARAHNVTLLSIHPPRKSAFVIHDLTYPELTPHFDRQRQVMTLSGKYGFNAEIGNQYLQIMIDMCIVLFENGPLQKWYREKRTFDVVIVDAVLNDCLLPIGHLFSDSTVLYNTANMFPWIAEAISAPIPYSYIPNGLLPFTPTMNFWQRLENMYSLELYKLGSTTYLLSLDNVVKRYFPDAISVSDSLKSATLVFTNADPVMNVARPNVPTNIDIGGIHCRPPEPLPQDFADVMDNVGEEGFILFSLGTIYDESFLSSEKRDRLMQAFARLNQTVIWKYERADFSVPKNVKIFKWIPQQDLLGHPKIKAFITHSGLLSVQEAIYHGVPMIGTPMFVDQPSNVAFATDLGIMVPLNWDELTADKVYRAVLNVITNISMNEVVKEYSKIFQDRLVGPKETFIYWIQYLLHHPGTNHLRLHEARHLTLPEYFQVDVLIVLITLVTSPICFIKLFLKIMRNPSTSPEK